MRSSVRTLALTTVLLLPLVHARAEEMFPPGTPGCFVGTEVMPVAANAAAYKPPVGVSAIRLERGFPQLAFEEVREPDKGEGRIVSVRILVTFADAARNAVKRFDSGAWDVMRCKGEVCEGGNYSVERQADGNVLLKITGGINVGGGAHGEGVSRRMPDGHVYRLAPKDMSACR